MYIERRTVGGVVVLDIKGKMVLGDGDVLLKTLVDSLASEGKKKVLLNLAECPYIDGAALGEIVRSYVTVKRQGGDLRLLNLPTRVANLLVITKFKSDIREHNVFDIYDNEAEAVASFR